MKPTLPFVHTSHPGDYTHFHFVSGEEEDLRDQQSLPKESRGPLRDPSFSPLRKYLVDDTWSVSLTTGDA